MKKIFDNSIFLICALTKTGTQLAFVAAALFPLSAIAQQTSISTVKPLVIIDNKATWYESGAWGNGAALTLDLPSISDRQDRSLDFLYGAAPQITFGCNSPIVKKSIWRLRVDFSAPGSIAKASPKAESEYERGTALLLGVPGALLIKDKSGQVVQRIALKPVINGLETAKISDRDRDLIVNAFALQIETPRLMLQVGTVQLANVIDKLSQVPCAAG